jgi:hypothetical protein
MEQGRREKVRHNETNLRQIAQAEIPMGVVTRSPEWKFFCEILQAKINDLDASIAALQESEATSPSFDPVEMARYKVEILRLTVQRDTLEQVMGLPKQIIEDGKQATLALEKYAD